MKKITKATVKKIIRKQGSINCIVLPCKANPYSIWFSGNTVEFNSIEDFEKFVNEFTVYNCNNCVGKYPAYYIED